MWGSTIAKVENSELQSLNFPEEDVILSKRGRVLRALDIKRIIHLTRLGMEKVTILFVDDKGVKQVESEISGYADDHITLTSAITIPFNRILHIT